MVDFARWPRPARASAPGAGGINLVRRAFERTRARARALEFWSSPRPMATVEAAIAVYLVRFGLSLGALALALVLWARQSRSDALISQRMSDFERVFAERLTDSERLRAELPTDTTAKIDGLRHQVAEFNESLTAHISKGSAREGRAARRERAEAEAPPEAPPSAAALEAQLGPRGVKRLLDAAASDASATHRSRQGGDGRG